MRLPFRTFDAASPVNSTAVISRIFPFASLQIVLSFSSLSETACRAKSVTSRSSQ